MEKTLLSKKELADWWSISISTLDRRIKEGTIKPIKGHKVPRFNIYDVLKAEGADVSKMSPFERRRLEREIEELKEERDKLLEEKREIEKGLMNMTMEILQYCKN